MIHSNAYPPFVATHIVDSIGSDVPFFRICEIMYPHLLGLSPGLPLLPVILEVPDQFFLLCVHRNYRISAFQVFLHLAVDVLELRVTVRVVGAFLGLPVRLQAVAQFLKDNGDHAVARLVPLLLQRRSQFAHALASPPQGRHGVATSRRIHQSFQIPKERRIHRHGLFSAAARAANPAGARRRNVRSRFQLGPPLPYNLASHSGGSGNRRNSSATDRQALSGCDKTPRAFIERIADRHKPEMNGVDINHVFMLRQNILKQKYYFVTPPKRDRDLKFPNLSDTRE